MKNLKKLLVAVCATFFIALSPSHIGAQEDDLNPSVEFVQEARCLATNLFFEARGEPLNGILGVAQTTINRTQSKHFPDTICGVVHQKGQFSWTSSKQKKISSKDYDRMYNLSVAVMNGEISNKKFKKSLYFHNTQVTPDWSFKLNRIGQVGNHVFYSHK